MGQASPSVEREWSHVNMPSRPTIWGKAQLLSAVVSRQAFKRQPLASSRASKHSSTHSPNSRSTPLALYPSAHLQPTTATPDPHTNPYSNHHNGD
jgi:hypothetical protein